MSILIIAEKPDLAKAIITALPGVEKKCKGYIEKGNYKVTWAYGHLFKLKEPDDYDLKYKKWELGLLPIYFDNWSYKPIENKKEQINVIKNLLKEADSVIHAGDVDEEGQLIVDNIVSYFNYKGEIKRLLVNDMNTEYIKKALVKMKDNSEYYTLGKSAYARSVSDYLVGINYSRFFSLKNNQVLSVGRVQTPTLGLVVNRDYLIENHIKENYYELFVDTIIDNKEIQVKYLPSKNNPNLEDGKIKDKSILTKLEKELVQKNYDAIIGKQKQLENPPLPFNLVKLQSFISSKFGYSPAETLEATQSLREKHKAITYNRSDCQYLNDEQFNEAPSIVANVQQCFGINTALIDIKLKSKAFNSANTTAHTAIIPTDIVADTCKMSKKELDIYKTICDYYLIQFMPGTKKIKTEMIINLMDGDMLKATSTEIVDKGFKEYLQDKGNEKETLTALSTINEGNYNAFADKGNIIEKETNPPARYTEATLNEDMTRIAKYVTDPNIKELLKRKDKDKKGENGSIGTSATRVSIIQTIITRGFVKKEGNKLISTELGREFYNMLPDEIKKADMTAKWWVIQEEIKYNTKVPKDLFEDVLSTIKGIIARNYTKLNTSSSKSDKEVIGTCPRCSKNVYESNKSFYCEGYKDCNFAVWKNNKFFEAIGFKITKTHMKNFIKKGKTHAKGLTSKKGSKYEADIAMDSKGNSYVNFKLSFEENNKVEEGNTNSFIGKCPRCKKNIIENNKAFSCEGYKETPSCSFAIWKNNKFFTAWGINITKQDVISLLNNGECSVLSIKEKKSNKLLLKLKDSGDKYVNFEIVKQ